MKVLLVDDEPLARSRLRRLLGEFEGVEVVGECGDGAAALGAVRDQAPDVVLLDVRMPGMDGMEAAAAMTALEQPPAIIFCTAYDDYAVAAFDAQAVGYLVKPVERPRLRAALERTRRINRAQLTALGERSEPSSPGRAYLCARTRRGVERVAVEQVLCLLADQKYVSAVHTEGELLLDESLTSLEREFGPHFVRVHRSALVARAYLRGIQRLADGGYRARVEGMAAGPPVSRRHLAAVKAVLEEH